MSDAALSFNGGPPPLRQALASPAYEASRVFSTSPCVLQNLLVTNKSAGDRYLMVFNATSLPGNGAVPAYPPVWVPTKSAGEIDEELAGGINFSAGLVGALSSTEDTLTVAVAADGMFKATIT